MYEHLNTEISGYGQKNEKKKLSPTTTTEVVIKKDDKRREVFPEMWELTDIEKRLYVKKNNQKGELNQVILPNAPLLPSTSEFNTNEDSDNEDADMTYDFDLPMLLPQRFLSDFEVSELLKHPKAKIKIKPEFTKTSSTFDLEKKFENFDFTFKNESKKENKSKLKSGNIKTKKKKVVQDKKYLQESEKEKEKE